MTKYNDNQIVTALDIGTFKIAVVIARITPNNELSIISAATSYSKGMDKGGVNNLEKVVESIQLALNEAQMMTEQKIESVFLGISGKHVTSKQEIGMVAIANDEVTEEDVDNVIYTAKSVKIPDENRILHVVPQTYEIDYQENIKNPVGLSGVRMKAKVHLVTCHNDMAKNIEKCAQRCNLNVDKLIFSGIASSSAVLTEDEKELGVCLIDIGAGTMDVVIYCDGAIKHTLVFPFAGNSVTSDIAYMFGTPLAEAEEIKIRYGAACIDYIENKDSVIEIPNVGGRPKKEIKNEKLVEIINARYSELFYMVDVELKRILGDLKQEKLSAGIVLTGGGSQIKGIIDCAENIFNSQVRIGSARDIKTDIDYIDSPIYSNAIGLLKFGKRWHNNEVTRDVTDLNVKTFVKKVSSWIKSGF